MLKKNTRLLLSIFLFSSLGSFSQLEAICDDITVELSKSGEVIISPEQLDGGTVLKDEAGIFTSSEVQFGCIHLGENSVTLQVEDHLGNTSTCVSTVTVVDMIAPAVACKNLNLRLGADGLTTIKPIDLVSRIEDNCLVADWRISQSEFHAPGVYEVKLNANDLSGNNGFCQSTVRIYDSIDDSNSSDDRDAQNSQLAVDKFSFGFFPNPATDNLSLSLESKEGFKDQKFSVEIISQTGVNVFKDQLLAGRHLVDVSDLEAGVYFIKVTNGRESLVKKLTVN